MIFNLLRSIFATYHKSYITVVYFLVFLQPPVQSELISPACMPLPPGAPGEWPRWTLTNQIVHKASLKTLIICHHVFPLLVHLTMKIFSCKNPGNNSVIVSWWWLTVGSFDGIGMTYLADSTGIVTVAWLQWWLHLVLMAIMVEIKHMEDVLTW